MKFGIVGDYYNIWFNYYNERESRTRQDNKNSNNMSNNIGTNFFVTGGGITVFGKKNQQSFTKSSYNRDPCGNCNRLGHVSENCLSCSYCKSKGLNFFGHSDDKCFLKNPCECGKVGHLSSQCFEKEKKPQVECSHCKGKKDNKGRPLRFVGHTEETCFVAKPCSECNRCHATENCYTLICNGCKQEGRHYVGHSDRICRVTCEACGSSRGEHQIKYCKNWKFSPNPSHPLQGKKNEKEQKKQEFKEQPGDFPMWKK